MAGPKAVSNTAVAAAGRPLTAGRPVASYDSGGIQELEPSQGVQSETDSLLYSGYQHGTGDRHGGQGGQYRSRVVFRSASDFASTFSLHEEDRGGGRNDGVEDEPGFPAHLARSISIYEKNARTIAGERSGRGTSLNTYL